MAFFNGFFIGPAIAKNRHREDVEPALIAQMQAPWWCLKKQAVAWCSTPWFMGRCCIEKPWAFCNWPTGREFAMRSVLLGALITLAFTAANVCLGLKVADLCVGHSSGRHLHGIALQVQGFDAQATRTVAEIATAKRGRAWPQVQPSPSSQLNSTQEQLVV